jgi:23S rRNA pseudouridine1911/1915/1917 synthase
LKSLFQSRSVTKKYLALVRGHLKLDRDLIRKPIGVKSGTTQRSVRSTKDSKEAVTEYKVMERIVRFEDAEIDPGFKSSLLEVSPRTGRTHQIRVHLTSVGHPILGDSLYGPKQHPEWISRLMLHAYTLEFPLLSGERVEFTAPLDKSFSKSLKEAGMQGPL